jgi:hypothetical protein
LSIARKIEPTSVSFLPYSERCAVMACVPTAFHHPSKCLDKGHGRTGATHVTSSQKPATTTDNFPPHGNLTPPGVAPPPPAWSGRRSSQPASASWRGPSVSQPATPARIAARPPPRARSCASEASEAQQAGEPSRPGVDSLYEVSAWMSGVGHTFSITFIARARRRCRWP